MESFVQEWQINIYRGALIVRTPGTNIGLKTTKKIAKTT